MWHKNNRHTLTPPSPPPASGLLSYDINYDRPRRSQSFISVFLCRGSHHLRHRDVFGDRKSAFFYAHVPLFDFLTATQWDPRFDEDGGSFSPWPLLWGTFYISVIAMLFSLFFGLLTAIHMVYYASEPLRQWLKPALELLAGIPTVVYGFFALVFLGPVISDLGHFLGIAATPSSILAAGITMGIMLIPFISSLSDDILSALPSHLKDGSLALGSTSVGSHCAGSVARGNPRSCRRRGAGVFARRGRDHDCGHGSGHCGALQSQPL